MALQSPPLPRPTPIARPTRAELEELEMEVAIWKHEGRRLIETTRPAVLRIHGFLMAGNEFQAEQLAAQTVAHLDRFARRFGGEAA